jgi:PKHD-type hydroxylase
MSADLIDQDLVLARTISPLRLLGALTVEECEAAIELGLSAPLIAGQMYTPVEGYRESQISFVQRQPRADWLVKKVAAIATNANRDFGFSFDADSPIVQYTQYSVGGKIEWHNDYDNVGQRPRKLSISVQLSDPADYDGGGLEFFPAGELKWARAKGTAIVFPAFAQHRVAEVTRGVRRSLVVWFSGAAFR